MPFDAAIGQKSSSDDVTLKDADSTDDSSVKTGAQKINQGARLINTRMLLAAAGTGTVGTIASWADDGDVRGISAASCVSTSLSQSFLLSDSTTGTTQQLIVSNLSTKPTTVDIAVWGSETAWIGWTMPYHQSIHTCHYHDHPYYKPSTFL